MAGALAYLNVRVGADIRQLQEKLRTVSSTVKNLSKDLEKAGRRLTLGLTVPIIGLGTAAVNEAAKMEALTKGLESIMGSADAANKEIEKLREEAKKPGLGFEQAIRGSLRLQAIGLDADQSRKTLAAFGNALSLVGGTAADLDGVALALSQIAAKGKVSAEEINQLAERVPQIRKVLKDSFGTAEGNEISAYLKKSGQDVNDFIRIITDEFEKLPQAQNTLSNSFANLRNSVSQSLASVGKDINETFKVQEKVEALSDILLSLADRFRNLPPEVKKNILVFAAIAAAIGPVLFIVGKTIAVFTAMASVLTFLVSPVAAVIVLIGALAAAALYVSQNWSAFAISFSNAWKKAYNYVVDIINKILTTYSGFIKKLTFGQLDIDIADAVGIGKYETEVVPKFKSFGQSMKDFASGALKSLGLVGGGMTDLADKTVPSVDKAGGGIKDFGGVLDDMGKSLKERKKETIDLANALQKLANIAILASRQVDLKRLSTPKLGDITTERERINTRGLSIDPMKGLTSGQQNLLDISAKVNKSLKEQGSIMEGLSLEAPPLGEAFYTAAEALDFMAQSMARVADAGGTFKDVAAEIKRSAISVIGSMIRQGVATVVQGTLSKMSFLGPLAIPAGLAAGALAQGAFNSILSKVSVPAFAGGGIISGPTLGLMGEYKNAANNPEVVAPLDRLRNLMGSSNITVNVVGKISGRDIQLANDRNSIISSRLKGK